MQNREKKNFCGGLTHDHVYHSEPTLHIYLVDKPPKECLLVSYCTHIPQQAKNE